MTEELTPDQKAKTIPNPSGWKILCAVPELDETFEGTEIVKPDAFIKQEEPASTVLFVIKLGPDAYKDTAKFASGAWCKEGDFVLVRAYSGTRLKIFGREFRVINDDQVEGVVEDPRGISRV
jgi:co-chaperonin GroES (HSP10)